MKTKREIGRNLRRFRIVKRLSQAELANRANISTVAYSNIELGKSSPRFDTIQALSEALDVPLRDIVRSVPQLRSVRFRASNKLKDREHIIAELAKWLEDYSYLEQELDQNISSPIKRIAGNYLRRQKSKEIVIEAASKVRIALELSPQEPILNISGIIERNGIKILTYPYESSGFFGLSVGFEQSGPAILVNTSNRITVERWIFTTAHELGHLLLHHGSYDVENNTMEEREEREADWFAANFLVPDKGFIQEWSNLSGMSFYDQVLSIKRLFHVSYKTILYRLSELLPGKHNFWAQFNIEHKKRNGKTLSIIDEPQAINSDRFYAGAPEVSRAKEPSHFDKNDFPVNRLKNLVRQAIEKEKISISRGAEILDMSVLEFRDLTNSWVSPEFT